MTKENIANAIKIAEIITKFPPMFPMIATAPMSEAIIITGVELDMIMDVV